MILIVGDPHVRPDNLAESEKLLEYVESTAKQYSVQTIVFLGDLFHTHRVIRMEVQNFWIKWAKRLGKIAKVILMVGNHDQPGDDQSEGRMSALDVLKGIEGVQVVDSPSIVEGMTFLPHTADQERFAHWVSESNTPYLFCHQTFDGSQYENGFYAKDGLPLDYVKKFQQVISGHIHKGQEFGNVWYPGTARWDSISDANESKGLWLVELPGNSRKFLPTSEVCQPIVSIEIREGDEIPTFPFSVKAHIKLIGSSSWIANTAKSLKGKVRISAKPTDKKFSGDRSRLASLESYAETFKFDDGISAKDVVEYIEAI